MSKLRSRPSLALLSLLFAASCGTDGTPPKKMNEPAVRSRIKTLLRDVDSAEYAARAPLDEFIVDAFRLAHRRTPSALELRVMKDLAEASKLRRSEVLNLILAGADGHVTEQVARSFLERGAAEALRDTADVRALTGELRRVSLEEATAAHRAHVGRSRSETAVVRSALAPSSVSVANQVYNTYFGFLHSHTGYSDGQGTPDQAYRHARDQGEMDFFSVTDHSELLSTWWWNNEWQRIKNTADSYNNPGQYVTLWGFEYSNPLLGHALVLNTTDFTSAFNSLLFTDLYGWIEQRPAGFGTFNHPGNYDDVGLEFYHFLVTNPGVVPQMVGLELWNGGSGFDEFYYQNTWSGTDGSYYDVGNRSGWMFGALGGQDNHQPDWGTKNQFRTAVLATELTREAIIEAYRARRFYATEDKDLYLDVRCGGFPMGSRLTAVTRDLTITAHDTSGDLFGEVRLYRNGDLIGVTPVAGNAITASFSDPATTEPAYYYVIIQQTDDSDANGRNDEAIASPIWID